MFPLRAPKRFTFDRGRILAAISPDAPTGESLRYEGTYDKIRDARVEDDPVVARGVWTIPLKRADWGEVERLCLDALQNKSKDLQIAAWLVEAWLHLYGLAGLSEGLRLMTALSEAFWDSLHPSNEDYDLEYRLGPVVWMDEKLPVYIKLIPLTKPTSEDVKPYCWADWETSKRGADDGATQALFNQSAMLTSTDFLQGLFRDLDASMKACSELEAVLDRRCGKEAPSLRQLWATMDSIHGLIAGMLSSREIAEDGPRDTSKEERVPAAESDSESPRGPIRSRADAYRRLAEAANYLAATEPHSPTPYLVRRAIAWGSMRLEDVLAELVQNRNELGEIFRLLQISRVEKRGDEE